MESVLPSAGTRVPTLLCYAAPKHSRYSWMTSNFVQYMHSGGQIGSGSLNVGVSAVILAQLESHQKILQTSIFAEPISFTVGFTLQMVNLCSCHCLSYFPFTVTKSTQITANCSQWDCYRLVTVNSICQFSRWLSSVHFTGYKICCSACDDVSNCCSLRQVSTISQVHCHWDRHSTNTYIVSDISTSKVFINQF